MATPTDEQSFLGQVLAWAAAGIAAVGAWLWTTTMGRITKLEEGKVNQKTFDDYVARADKDRGERREAEINLFEKVDGLHRHFDSKIDKLTDLVRELRK
jgi:hypothetical protein